MQCTFYLAHATGKSALGFGVVFAVDFFDVAFGIFLATCAHHYVSGFQANFFARSHAEILLERIFHKVLALDVDFACEWHFVSSAIWIFGIVLDSHHFGLILGEVGDNHLHGVDNSRNAVGSLIQVVANGMLEQ